MYRGKQNTKQIAWYWEGLGSILPAHRTMIFYSVFKAHKKNTPMLPIKNQVCHRCFPNRTDPWLIYIHVIWTDYCKIQALPIVVQYETKTCCTSCNLSRQIATKFPKPELGHF